MKTGIVLDWKEEKGFGFIKPSAGGKNLFFHISDYSHHHKRPVKNLKVQYFTSLDSRGRNCAVEVVPTKRHKDNGYELRQKFSSLVLFSVFSAALFFLFQSSFIPFVILILYAVLSVVTFLMYAKDKNAAVSGKWRTSEDTLHILSLLGGWPGATLAQSFLRHKSKKTSFRIIYWATVCLNCGVLYTLTTTAGRIWLSAVLKKLNIG